RFAAGVDLDGSLFGAAVDLGVKQPFLIMLAKLTWRDVLPRRPLVYLEHHDRARLHEDMFSVNSPHATWATVKGLRHMNFADAGFHEGILQCFQEVLGIRLDAATTVHLASWCVQ